MLTRVVIPVAVALVVGAGTVQLWRELQRYETEQVVRIARLESWSTRSHLARSTNTLLDALTNVREFWDAFGGLPREQWRSDAHIELEHFDGIDVLLYHAADNDIRFLRSTTQTGFDHRPDDEEWVRYEALVRRLGEQATSTMLGPYRYPDGQLYIEVYLVSPPGEGARGLVALIDAEAMIGRLLLDEAPSYAIKVYWEDALLYARDEPGLDYPASWDQQGMIRTSLDALWRVVHRPTQEAVDVMHSKAGDTVLLLGSVIAVLMGFLTFESARARRRAAKAVAAERDVARLNRDLESIVEQRTAELARRTTDLETITDSVAHDLRNPLGAISMNAQLLKAQIHRGALDEAAALKALDRIQPNVTVISTFLDRLMGISALTHDTFERKPLDMRALFEDVFETLADAELPPPAQLALADDLPGVEADELLVRVLVTNLLANALKYTRERDQRRIEVGWVRQGGVTEYSVRDNGVGFDMKEADRLFQAFQRLSDGKRFQGTGLGLTIVSRVIQRHNGQIRAEGIPGEGAAFHFTLEPAADA